ncbi:MAG: hypothetical protein QOH13_2035 [Thermoleophilaceae bacterium]|nr:hypothetical protein [Thermoleophilaceae bacterium]
MAAIPPELIKVWSKMKADAPAVIRKTGIGVIPEASRKALAKDTEALFKTFDQGLKQAMQKASQAKDDVAVRKAMLEVQRIITDYQAKTTQWGNQDNALRAAIVKMVQGNLKKLDGIVKAGL